MPNRPQPVHTASPATPKRRNLSVDKDGRNWPQEPGRYQPGVVTKSEGRGVVPTMSLSRSCR